MKAGFVMLNREIKASGITENLELLGLYTYLLIESSYKEKTSLINGKQLTLPEGSLITSIEKLSLKFNCDRNKIRRLLTRLEETELIKRTANTHYTLINIEKTNQCTNQMTNQMTNQKTVESIDNKGCAAGHSVKKDQPNDRPKDQPADPTKEYNNNNKGKSNKYSSIDIRNIKEIKEPIFYKNSYFFIPESYKRELLSIYPGITPDQIRKEFDKMEIWIKDKGKHLTNYKNFISNWLQKAKPSPAAESHQMKISELNYV